MPDLIINRAQLANQHLIRKEYLNANDCSVIEGNVQPGWHRVLRFTISTPNIGTAAADVGNPQDHMNANDGLFEYATCHHHYHYRHYAQYQLVSVRTGKVWLAAKRGFCMVDSQKFDQTSTVPQTFTVCGTTTTAGNQGISPGWEDTYPWYIPGQYILLDGGDGQAVVPPGRYYIRATVNPLFQPAAGEACPYPDPSHPGYCHQLAESSYTNNTVNVLINVPKPASTAKRVRATHMG